MDFLQNSPESSALSVLGKKASMMQSVRGAISKQEKDPKGPSTAVKIVAADAAGAAGSLIIGAFAAAGTAPIAPVSFFLTVAAGAIWSSGTAALLP